MRDQAYAILKALLHLRIQRRCMGCTDDAHNHYLKDWFLTQISFKGRSRTGVHFTSPRCCLQSREGDPVVGIAFSNVRYCWLCHILRCRAWVNLRTKISMGGVIEFVQHAFSKEPLPSSRVIADCLLIVNMIVGGLPQTNDRRLIRDKR